MIIEGAQPFGRYIYTYIYTKPPGKNDGSLLVRGCHARDTRPSPSAVIKRPVRYFLVHLSRTGPRRLQLSGWVDSPAASAISSLSNCHSSSAVWTDRCRHIDTADSIRCAPVSAAYRQFVRGINRIWIHSIGCVLIREQVLPRRSQRCDPGFGSLPAHSATSRSEVGAHASDFRGLKLTRFGFVSDGFLWKSASSSKRRSLAIP